MNLNPLFVGAALLLLAAALAVAGVFLLLGLGWALVAAAVPTFFAGVIVLRGVLRGEPRG